MRITNMVLSLVISWCIVFPAQARLYSDVNATPTITLDTPVEFSRNTADEWEKIGRYLETSDHDTYIINWGGNGGLIDIGKSFINHIISAKAQGKIIVINIVGNSYSMHALVPCYATKVTNTFNLFSMFHADSYRIGETDYRASQGNSIINQELNQCAAVGRISYQGINTMWQGYEVYVTKTSHWYEPDLRPKGL